MAKIEIIKPCSCAKKRKSWNKKLEYTDMNSANEIADKMCIQGNEKFCKKHKFSKKIYDDKIEIITEPNK